jgi:hypothetical protein
MLRPVTGDDGINQGEHMHSIIGFLDQVGRNAAMRHASHAALLQAMREEEISTEHRNALLHSPLAVLDDVTGARATMYCQNQVIKAPKKKAPAKKKPAKKAPAKKPSKKAPAKRK